MPILQPSLVTSNSSKTQTTGPQLGDQIRLKLLVIAAERSDQNLSAITILLERIGIPYTTFVATETTLTQEQLWQGHHAFYQGVILTTGNLLYWNEADKQWQSAFDLVSWQLLWRYEARFGIRQLILYALGGSPENYGLQLGDLVSTVGVALPLTLTAAGCAIFPYLNQQNAILVNSAPVYLAEPADGQTVPLLVTQNGQCVAALGYSTDGRETLALTMAHGPDLIHSLLLGYGLVTWVTRGLFLGERHIYLSIQIDDILNQNYLWDPQLKAEGKSIYRLSSQDVNALVKWLDQLQKKRNSGQITVDFAYNGAGILGNIATDDLATTLLEYQHRFRWINHGHTHLLLDEATYVESHKEIRDNHAVAVALQFDHYEPTNMVTADVSGLENGEFLRAASTSGIRRLVSDTSKRGWDNPTPNTGIANPLQPDVLCIPRHPNNLFYDVSTPAEWASKYNHIYLSYWRRDLSVAEIIEQEAEMILRYLLHFDIDPLMFHQANLRAYDGVHSLLAHLIDKVVVKYNALYGDVPIVCCSMEDIGVAMLRRAAYNAATIEATLTVGCGLTLTADRDVTVPVTGISTREGSEWYAGQSIACVALSANVPYQLPYTQLLNSTSNGILAAENLTPNN
ncbi:MAG: hypothetical protein R3C14_52095 [Caldilineaceae bacterium]